MLKVMKDIYVNVASFLHDSCLVYDIPMEII